MKRRKKKLNSCPTPWKMKFRDEIAAKLAAATDSSDRNCGLRRGSRPAGARDRAGRGAIVVPYECRAGGHWHLESPDPGR